MKSKEEIFESTVKNTRFEQLSASSDIGQAIIMGYTQCQEDIRELLLEIKNNWTGDKLIGGTYEKICNSLNKQD